MFCRYCGKQLNDGQRFCPNCGQPQTAPKAQFCTGCGTKLEPGAKLFVYTDGVPEAERADREQFGLERTLTVLRRFEDLPPQSIVTGMSTAVYDFVGDIPQFDDLTMLVLHYKGFSPNGQN